MSTHTENDLDLIVDYINGELSYEQKIKFEERLAQENDLVESLRFQKEIRQAFLRMQISEQVNSIHEEVKFSETADQNKAMGISKNSGHKTQTFSNIIRKIAAVFIPIIFIICVTKWQV
jgi:hypothetical protein